MRILHVYRTYFPDSQGGLEEVIRQICLNTGPIGSTNRVLALSRSPMPDVVKRSEAAVYRSKLLAEIASCSMSISAFARFKDLSAWADVIHYHFPWPFADLLHFSARPTKATVVTYHSDIVRQKVLGWFYAPLMTRFLQSVDRIVCTSANYLATSAVLQRFSRKVEVIPIGIDEAIYPPQPRERLVQAEAAFGRDFFLFVGVLRYYKGLHVLLNAIKGAPYRLLIVGAGPMEMQLQRQARKLGLDNVVFTGYLPDAEKSSLFALCRGVVLPSCMRSEAFGVTLLEGAMHGRPLISTEVGSGTSYVNLDGKTGLVVPPGSADALRQAMDRLWLHPDLAGAMGRNARARYEALFTGALMGQRYFRLYQELVTTSRERSRTKSSRVQDS